MEIGHNPTRGHEQVGDVDLDATLQRLVDAAVTVTGARSGAIGVWAADGTLLSFVHAGFLRPRVPPLRLTDSTRDPVTAGFARHDPVVRAFLGVPIPLRDGNFGVLLLTDDRPGHDFGDPDELTAGALAEAAAVAVDNARTLDEVGAAARWTDASREITAALLADGGADQNPLTLVAARAQELTGAEQCIVLVPADPENLDGEDSSLVVAASVGRFADEVLGEEVPIEGSTSGAVFRSGEPLITDTFRRPIHAFTDVGARPAIVVPLRAENQVVGVLAVARNESGARFDESQLGLMGDFADHAAIALAIARGRRDAAEMRMLADRERIAHDLHDQVIQRVFAVGLDLQGVIARVTSPQLAQRLARSVDELHAVINDIRTTVFDLQHPGAARDTFAKRIQSAFSRITEERDVVATLRISGPMTVVNPRLADHAEAVVVEAVSNAIRHSGAHAVTVDVTVGDDLTIAVTDDGAGFAPGTTRRSGLANLARRAEEAGGAFTVSGPPGGGTRVVWSAPLQDG